MTFIFHSINACITFVYLRMIILLYSWGKFQLIIVYDPFNVLLSFVCSILLIFCVYIYHGYWSVIFL